MPQLRSVALSMLLLLVLAVLPFVAGAQLPSVVTEWDTLRPEGEEFSILMPKNSTAETSKEPYHKMILNTRLYLSTNTAGPVFAVVSLSGIKANPAMYTEMERMNSYIDAFKHWFPAKVRGKDAIAKLDLVGEKTLSGHAGREYKVAIGDLSGLTQVYATRRRFYAIVYLNTKKDDSIQERFLSSFVLPQRVEETPATVATQAAEKKQEPATLSADSQLMKPDEQPQATDTKEVTKEATPETKREEAPAGKRAPIQGGVLNNKAISLPQPEWPASLRESTGTIVISVVIDEQGNVISAAPVSGPQQLHPFALKAAMQAKFAPTLLMGEPVRVSGVITFAH
jgi:TonB-like protein